ncbi:hypothetical protein GIB67_016215 [Kingdonia uniflora]|uniref:Uncharacterized protein n=1 Tax=Kingdonia uniflora TaxID=39325 RepID=A0A7J7LSY2_9MAGN|nr:hypothetical protein GIB67_016215 [Kingdonia uniflora]
MALDERIASEMQRLKLKYFGDDSLEMSIPAPIPLMYQGLSEAEVVGAEEDFYYKWRFYVVVLTGEDRWVYLRTLVKDRVKALYVGIVRERIFGSFGYDVELPVREYQLEGLDVRSRELEYARYFYEVYFRELVRDAVERERTSRTGNLAQPNPTKSSKITLKYPKKWMLKALPASGTTGSGEVTKDKRRRVEPSRESGEKVAEGRSVVVDGLKGVIERARLVVLHREEDTNKMLQVEAKANLDEMVEERDRLGHHLMLKGYSEEEVDAIKVDTYVEEKDEEEAEAVGIVDGLDGVSYQTVLDNQGDSVDLPEGGSEKVEEKDAKINKGLKELAENILEGEIKVKESLMKRKEEFLKDILAREELNAKIWRLRARVVDLEVIYLAKSAKYTKKLEENVIYHAKVDAKMTE